MAILNIIILTLRSVLKVMMHPFTSLLSPRRMVILFSPLTQCGHEPNPKPVVGVLMHGPRVECACCKFRARNMTSFEIASRMVSKMKKLNFSGGMSKLMHINLVDVCMVHGCTYTSQSGSAS